MTWFLRTICEIVCLKRIGAAYWACELVAKPATTTRQRIIAAIEGFLVDEFMAMLAPPESMSPAPSRAL